MKAEILCQGNRQALEIENGVEVRVFRAPDGQYRYLLSWSNVAWGQGSLKRQDVLTSQIYLTEAEFGQLVTEIDKIAVMPAKDEKGEGIREYEEQDAAEERSIALWDAVICKLISKIQHHRAQTLLAITSGDGRSSDFQVKAMHRAAKTLAVFTDPNDD